MNIADHVGLVTGGASGLGEAVARMLVENGAKAAILDFDETRGIKVSEALGTSALFLKTDVTDETSVAASVAACMEQFGSISFAVSCAGVGTPEKVLSRKGPMDMGNFTRTVQINLIGTMNVVVHSVMAMNRNMPDGDGAKGVIVNTSSIAAFEGQIGQAAYSASKAGVAGMTLPLAREFADYGVRVVTVAPGLFETPMMESLPEKVKDSLKKMVPFPKRLGRPDEFASFVRHIIENPQLNGETVRLDSAIRM